MTTQVTNSDSAVSPEAEAILAQPKSKLLIDKEIKAYVEKYDMMRPFSDHLNSDGVISWGLSSMGYDIRIADEFKIFTNVWNSMVDPKKFDDKSFVDFKGKECVIPPNSFALARTVEYFKIPRNILTICLGKSTYARCGLILNVTPFEPDWEGYAVLEVSNTTPLPAKIYANEGIGQLLFFASEEPCDVSYRDRKGKYQKQQSIVLPKIKKD
jgi:dCTP deaminase